MGLFRWFTANWANTTEPTHADLAPVVVPLPSEEAAGLVRKAVGTLPLWLIPGMGLVLPIYWLAWLNRRTFAYDALAAHATKEEWKALFEKHRGKLLLLGVLLGLVAHVPLVGLLAPAFGALAYVHYGLEALRRERRGAAAVIEGEARRV